MNHNLETKEKLVKKRKNVVLFILVFWLLSFNIYFNAISIVLPLSEIICILFNVNVVTRNLLLSLMEFFYRYLLTIVTIGGKLVIDDISREIIALENSDISYQCDCIEKDNEPKIIDYEEVLEVYGILERFEKLPRKKQMEVLNYIKGDLSLYDEEISEDINKLSDKYKYVLQMECEDILFPDYEDDKAIYTRNKKK